jgi:hypothetical protein
MQQATLYVLLALFLVSNFILYYQNSSQSRRILVIRNKLSEQRNSLAEMKHQYISTIQKQKRDLRKLLMGTDMSTSGLKSNIKTIQAQNSKLLDDLVHDFKGLEEMYRPIVSSVDEKAKSLSESPSENKIRQILQQLEGYEKSLKSYR